MPNKRIYLTGSAYKWKCERTSLGFGQYRKINNYAILFSKRTLILFGIFTTGGHMKLAGGFAALEKMSDLY